MSSSSSAQQLHLPAGFRFHPTDEELVVDYLVKKAECKAFPVPVIADVDLYKFSPWELPSKAYFGEREWYFFTSRDRKYPNGARPNRAAGSGYWKATGTDKPIHTKGNRKVGVKKALVFYDGKAPKGVKTNWIMHEYRLIDKGSPAKPNAEQKSLRLDDWVLCRIYEKTSGAFKVMVSSKHVETEAEPEPETEAESQSGLEEMLAALPDIAPPDTIDPNQESLISWDLSDRTGALQPQYQDEYPANSGFENGQELSSYWSLDPQSNTFGWEPSPVLKRTTPGGITDMIQHSRKRTKLTIEDDDVQSTCRSPHPSCHRHQHYPYNITT